MNPLLAALGIAAANLVLTAPAAAVETQAVQLSSECAQQWFDCAAVVPVKLQRPVAKPAHPVASLPPTLPMACPTLDGMPACGL